ncbi:hypothetical protein HMPREF1984_00237 [Leptotrichia sp. oral taxon 215 str. W9775]|jgi:hypothetical protein|uniref:hypothetical protein n=1 Tax=Leptotrichia sp. oral taxon 215 TaxID=712359 RepID=UPI0003ADC273|nr:hypothetical protein [Leptotrichia sp. oral taxon 215]ERK68949.1 hypothetical protein HMPREF1984_00237 [Leptotrichia sp. oral taxon 215 str. W9775]MBF1336366.1 RNA polymerase subunit sigma [Leptotrichia sp.]
MIERIVEDVRKNGSFSFEKIIENNNLSDDEFFEFLKFVYQDNIPEVRTSVDGKDFIVLEDENYYVEEKETIKAYLENVKEKNEEMAEINEKTVITDENRTEMVEKYLKIAVRESLLYSKYGFSFLDMVQEATLGVITALNYYEKILLMTEEMEFFIKNFAVKYILEFQKDLLKDIKASELSYILYLKVKVDKELGHTVDEISKRMNVTKEYIEKLEKLFDNVELDEMLESSQILEKANKITQMYILENIPKKLSYIDERILVMSYGLDDKIYSENEIAKSLNIAKHNVNILKEKALNKLSIDLLKNEFMKNSEETDYTVN